MNARDIIKLAAQLYVYDALKKMFVSEVEFMLHKKQLNRVIKNTRT